jgi:uncharacterized membrane protein
MYILRVFLISLLIFVVLNLNILSFLAQRHEVQKKKSLLNLKKIMTAFKYVEIKCLIEGKEITANIAVAEKDTIEQVKSNFFCDYSIIKLKKEQLYF